MTRDELPVDKQIEYDRIVDEFDRELKNRLPEETESKDVVTLDGQNDVILREVTNKYLPRLEQILFEAEQEEYERSENKGDYTTRGVK